MTCRHGSPPDKCRICNLEKQLADQKAITELAVKGLKEVNSIYWKDDSPARGMLKIADDTLSEIARLQNE